MSDSTSPIIEKVRPEDQHTILPELINLLQDTVSSGASVGFLPPLSKEEAHQYWEAVFQEVAQGTQILLVARSAGQIVGSVQLALATRANARHRAEVQKLFVFQTQRRQGIGRMLMQAVEEVARTYERTLLVLDTRQGDAAEQLYRNLAYREAGVIPAFAQSATGELCSTVFFYKMLQPL